MYGQVLGHFKRPPKSLQSNHPDEVEMECAEPSPQVKSLPELLQHVAASVYPEIFK